MSSPAQVLANQKNAVLSTGPVTEEGKAASSGNSYRHGAYATRLRFATQEEETAFQQLHESYRNCYRPADERESKCVYDIVRTLWLIGEADYEDSSFTAELRAKLSEDLRKEGLDADHHLAARMCEARVTNKTLANSDRRLRHLHTTYYRALRYLLQFQKERKRNNIQENVEAKQELIQAESWEAADVLVELPSSSIGFVPSATPLVSKPKGKGLPPKARRWR